MSQLLAPDPLAHDRALRLAHRSFVTLLQRFFETPFEHIPADRLTDALAAAIRIYRTELPDDPQR